MIRRHLSALIGFLLISAVSAPVFAQKKQYTLKGFMGIQGGESFTYLLHLHDSTGNIMAGYGYTYTNEKNDVKAAVIATIDRGSNSINLREVSILYNNYFVSKATICLVDAKLTYNKNEQTLSGPLNTNTAGNGAECSRGSISFSNAGEINALFNATPQSVNLDKPVEPETPKPEVKKPAIIVYDTVAKAKPKATVPEVKKTESITEGKGKTYTWQSDNIVMEIWDGNNEDNDRVTILMNGEEVLKNHMLTKERKKLTFPVGGNELNIISIVANNEGSDPPNTANILLLDNDIQYEIIAHNTTGKKAMIHIKRKKP